MGGTIKKQSLFVEAEEDPFICDSCKFYSALVEPRTRGYDAVIYGYCFQMGDRNHSPNMGKGYAVFIQGGRCKSWKK